MRGAADRLRRLPLERHLAPVLTVVFVGVLLSTLAAYFFTRDTVEGMALSQTHETLGFLDREIASRVMEMTIRLEQWTKEDMLRLALETSYLGDSAREAAKRRMATQAGNGSFDRVFLIRPDGSIAEASSSDMAGRFTVGDRRYFRQAMEGEISLETLTAGRHSNRPMLVAAAPVRNGEGGVVGVMAVAIDTERFAQELLGGVRIGRNGLGYILSEAGQVLAIPRESGPGQPWSQWRMDKVRQSVRSANPVAFEEDGIWRLLVAGTNAATGWYLVLEADESDILRPAVRIAWITGGVSLATLALAALALAALGRAMTGMRQSEEKFSRVFMFAPDVILLADMETGKVVDANQAFTTRTGYLREEILGKTSAEIPLYANPADREAFHSQLLRDGHVNQFECESRYKDGSLAVCSLSGQIVTIGARRYLMTIVRDVTEIKRMQEMMVQTEKMISVGGIAAGIAHEINNPLGIVLQAAQNLTQRTRPDFRKNVEAAKAVGLDMQQLDAYMKARKLDVFIADIQSAASRASAIIRHMLDFSRRSESRRAVSDLRTIADNAINLASNDYDLKKSYDFKKIDIKRDYPAELTGIGCTATEIEQVLLNVLRNAAQALAAADPPVAAPCIAVRITERVDRVRIVIEDNGPGVPEHVKGRIFEPFYTTKQPGVGTGLGLSVSYFIVTKGHGGVMSLAQSPLGGAAFVIDLPMEGGLTA